MFFLECRTNYFMKEVVVIFSSVTPHDIKLVFFYMFPDSILLFFVALKLFEQELNWKKIIITSICLAPLNLVMRQVFTYFNIPISTVGIVMASILALFLIVFYKFSIIRAIISALIIHSLTLMGDTILNIVMVNLKLTLDQVFASVALNTFIGFVEEIYVIILALFLMFTKINLKNILK